MDGQLSTLRVILDTGKRSADSASSRFYFGVAAGLGDWSIVDGAWGMEQVKRGGAAGARTSVIAEASLRSGDFLSTSHGHLARVLLAEAATQAWCVPALARPLGELPEAVRCLRLQTRRNVSASLPLLSEKITVQYFRRHALSIESIP